LMCTAIIDSYFTSRGAKLCKLFWKQQSSKNH
jgi:hypothetical protein